MIEFYLKSKTIISGTSFDRDISLGLSFDLGPLLNDPWFGWQQALDNNLDGQQSNVSKSDPAKEEKPNLSLLDARLKAIEARLNNPTFKVVKFEPNKVIEIMDDSTDDITHESNLKITSNRMKEEKEDSDENDQAK